MTQLGPKEAQRRALRYRGVAVSKPTVKAATKPPRAKAQRPPPTEPRTESAEPTIAPPGECAYCDRRRAHTREAVERLRKRASASS